MLQSGSDISETLDPVDLSADWLESAVSLEIDLGCHRGAFVVAMAQQFPHVHFLGIERQRNRVERSCAKIARLALENARVIQGEGLEMLRDQLPAGIAAAVHISFPDPWPKRRHHDRRLVNRDLLREAWRVLEPGGVLRLMTDDAPYFAAMCKAAEGFDGFPAVEWEDGRIYPETEFQKKFIAIAKPIHRLALRRCASMSSE